jgi:hypothetical protein
LLVDLRVAAERSLVTCSGRSPVSQDRWKQAKRLDAGVETFDRSLLGWQDSSVSGVDGRITGDRIASLGPPGRWWNCPVVP